MRSGGGALHKSAVVLLPSSPLGLQGTGSSGTRTSGRDTFSAGSAAARAPLRRRRVGSATKIQFKTRSTTATTSAPSPSSRATATTSAAAAAAAAAATATATAASLSLLSSSLSVGAKVSQAPGRLHVQNVALGDAALSTQAQRQNLTKQKQQQQQQQQQSMRQPLQRPASVTGKIPLPQELQDQDEMREVRALLRRQDFSHRQSRQAHRIIPGTPAVQPEIRQYTAMRPLTHHGELKVNNTITESIRDIALEDSNHWRRAGTGSALSRGQVDRGDWTSQVCSSTDVGFHFRHKSLVNRRGHGGAASSQLKSRAARFPDLQARFARGGTSGSYVHQRPGARVPPTVGPGSYDVDKFYNDKWHKSKEWNLKGLPYATTFGRSARSDIALTINGQLRTRDVSDSESSDEDLSDSEDSEAGQRQTLANRVSSGAKHISTMRKNDDSPVDVQASPSTYARQESRGNSPRSSPRSSCRNSPLSSPRGSPTQLTSQELAARNARRNRRAQAEAQAKLAKQRPTSPRHDSSSKGTLVLNSEYWRRKGVGMPKAPLQAPWRIDHDIPGPGAYGKLLSVGVDAYRKAGKNRRNLEPSVGTGPATTTASKVVGRDISATVPQHNSPNRLVSGTHGTIQGQYADDRGQVLAYSTEKVTLKLGRNHVAGEGIPVFGLVGGAAPAHARKP